MFAHILFLMFLSYFSVGKENPSCWNWVSETLSSTPMEGFSHGSSNPSPFYSAPRIEEQQILEFGKGNAETTRNIINVASRKEGLSSEASDGMGSPGSSSWPHNLCEALNRNWAGAAAH